MSASTTLVLDADQRSALAVTRSLGSHGIDVFDADCRGITLAGGSRFSRRSLTYPDPTIDAEGALDTIGRIVAENGVKHIFPMTDISVDLILANRHLFENVGLPCPDYEKYCAASDKHVIAQIARELGIAVPQYRLISSQDKEAERLDQKEFPIVVKPRRSRIRTGNGYHGTEVKIARSKEELDKILAADRIALNDGLLLQEYIEGSGAGIFALYRHGKRIALFAHRRLREKPPSGGVSVLSESIAIDATLGRLSQRLLEKLNWHGPAMIEYRVDNNGTPYLMEINARFWGSLQLSINAGVDFPYLAWQIAAGKQVDSVDDYAVGVRNRWLLGDLDHLYLTWRSENKRLSEKFGATLAFLNFFAPRTSFEVLRLKDLKPFLRELRAYVKQLFK